MTNYQSFFLRPFILAIQLLTRLPTPQVDAPNSREIGCSLIYYPLVGLLLGLILSVLAYAGQLLFPQASSDVIAALIIFLWVVLTGALHLDGLADSADAWIGSQGDKQKMLEIMKDSRSGPVAIAILIATLLVKWSALSAIIASDNSYLLILIPLIARAFILLLFSHTTYISEQGMAQMIMQNFPKDKHLYTMLVISALIIFSLSGIGVVLVCALVFLLLRQMMKKSLGGFNGDTTGAMVELLEMAALAYLALSL